MTMAITTLPRSAIGRVRFGFSMSAEALEMSSKPS